MPPGPPAVRKPIRKGRTVCLTLDLDAVSLLYAMQPNSKGIGLLVSELVRKEAERRAGRPAILAALTAQQHHGGRE